MYLNLEAAYIYCSINIRRCLYPNKQQLKLSERIKEISQIFINKVK